ncbi:hypothetical protein HNQ93_004313 [Hymenobacter luteus]|uniref:DUF2628 domain-containing protein n=2 Tax=Hymenobacter TaxID=89966 RepID=A0A7W9WCZ2_9BACT|nr:MULTISPECIES: DUF2628 domain-containing protein [Hymenobacter]MBB4601518.1 hypothetical protein [Hymenobacter latericoloratus]MBB6061434.1 hypothetical protein [Hymenobacter luteus]
MSQPSTQVEIEDEYAWTFFGSNAEYYLKYWRLRQQGNSISFNASAFFGGLFWFAYRRMYLILFLIVVVAMLEGMLEDVVFRLPPSTGRTLLANLVFCSLYGFLGNSLYLWYAERRMRKILHLGLPKEELLRRLRRAGGTSWSLLLVLLGVAALSIGAYYWLSHT